MSLKKLTNITPAELKSKGVVSLADKPNAAASYGVGGLSPTALKLWFDQLSKLLADKINAIQDALSGDNAAEYIKLILTGLDSTNETGEYSLQDLCDAFKNGNFAEYLQAYGSAAAENLSSLQAIINAFALDISTAKETAEDAKDAAETAENNRIIETAVEYQEGTSGTSAPTGAWSSAIPAVQEGRYLWTRVTLTFASGSTAVFYSVGKIAARGDVNLEVGTVTTETIDAGLNADFDVSVRHEEGTNKVLLDFDAKIPRGESGTDDEAVHFTPQTLTEPQQTQAQQNMGIGLSYEQLEDGTYNLVIRLTGDVPSNAAITQINGNEVAGKEFYDYVRTVGAVLFSFNPDFSPAALYGGSWEKITDRFLVGAGGSYTLGSTGGNATHTNTIAEMAPHNHGLPTVHGEGGYMPENTPTLRSFQVEAKANNNQMNINGTATDRPPTGFSGPVGSTGGGQPFSILPPYLAVNIWRRVA